MMTSRFILAFLPELVLLAGALGLFAITVSDAGPRRARTAALGLALARRIMGSSRARSRR